MRTDYIEAKMQVVFNFGGVAYVSIKLYDGMTLEECIKRRSEDIVGYISGGKYHEVGKEGA